MQIKGFLVGALFGLGAYWFVDAVVSSDQTTLLSGARESNERSVDVLPRDSEQGIAETRQPESQSAPVTTTVDEESVAVMTEPLDSSDVIAPQSVAVEKSTEAKRESQTEFSTRPTPREVLDHRRRELAAEPRDESTAAYMEQAILQFLGSHANSSSFDVSYIECRTVTCQIQVVGFDASTYSTWLGVMYDFKQYLPNDNYEWGTSSYEDDGRFVIVQTIKDTP